MKLHSKIFFSLLLISSARSFAQTADPASGDHYWKWTKGGNFYFSWGYNKEWYTKSDIHINQTFTEGAQAGQHTEYTLHDILAHDHIGWDEVFKSQLTIPQYNYRLGYFFNKKQDLGIELNFDHTKYVVQTYQHVRMSGITNGVAFDSTAFLYPDTLTGPKPFYYQLNNGANFFLVNLMKKWTLYQSPKGNINFSYIARGGVGWMVPHVQNLIFGNNNTPHFQFGGWDVGVESALRCVFYKYAYLEFSQKGTYASYSHLRIYEGTSKQSFGCYELVLSLGVNIPHISKKFPQD